MQSYHRRAAVGALLALVMLLLPLECLAHGFAIGGGLSTPRNEINNVYNGNRINGEGELSNFLRREAPKIGFHIGVRYYLELDEEFSLAFGLGWHRFGKSHIGIFDEDGSVELALLQATQNFVPISVGLDYPLFRDVVGFYLAGDLQYNYIFNTIDIVHNDLAIPFADSPSDNRVGASLGAGVEFDLAALILDVGLRVNHANLIGKEESEGDKTYITFNVSALFGEKTDDD